MGNLGMLRCTTIQRKIKVSILSLAILFMVSASSLAASMMWFDFRVHQDPMPQSMVENPRPAKNGKDLVLLIFLGMASVTLPLGFTIFRTLHECHEFYKQDEHPGSIT